MLPLVFDASEIVFHNPFGVNVRREISQIGAGVRYLCLMNFVTGGTGMVGMHFIAQLLRKGEPVRALIRPQSSRLAVERFLAYCALNPKDVEWVEGDVLDLPSLEDAMTDVRRVFHSAALVSFHRSDRDLLYHVNVGGTSNVVNVALSGGCESLVHVSSVAALGRNSRGLAVHEDSEWKDSPYLTHYSRSKHMAEREVWRGHEEGLDVVVVNPSVILGIGDFGRSSAEIFSRVKAGLPVYPGGSNGFVAVQDVVDASFHLLENNHLNRRFLLNGDHLTFKDLFTRIANECGVKPPSIAASPLLLQFGRLGAWLAEAFGGKKAFITRESIRNSGMTHRYDASRIFDETGFRFTPIDEVLHETVRYMKHH